MFYAFAKNTSFTFIYFFYIDICSLCSLCSHITVPSPYSQDCYGHHTNNTSAFFAVYDGHGPHGEHCSHFVRGKLPALLKSNIQKHATPQSSPLSTKDIHASLHEAHVACNDELRQHADINDHHSGTTSVGVFVHNGRITISNVGDSRIVLGTQANNNNAASVQAVPLSKDHTPYREDEAERCVASGARILSFGEIDPSTKEDGDSEVEDPPRVWSKHGNYPGTAFTRSIGDAIAEQLGVYAEPELLTLPISPNERLLVLASDGVFDVVSNQDVVNICFLHRNDPAKACGAILDKSHEEWLLNDDCEENEANYDDMTCVVVYFDHPEHEGIDSSRPPPQAQQKARRQGKRVRQKTLENLDEMGK